MKLLRSHDDVFVFGFEAIEKRALLDTLKSISSIPPSRQPLSKSTLLATAENQRLLDESLAAQRVQNQKEITALLTKPDRLKRVANQWQFTVTRPEIEILLQMLNDVRLGSWTALGCPDLDREDGVTIDEESLPYVLRMELAGHLEEFFIRAVSDEMTPE
ncbi:MAG TPA: hypothetical protein VH255_06275 [Verrucomicrobiae bacterium]|jgi:hypothetical protein|nr:hypothetical protein [Verrucomicrobiae bacterium]